MALTSPGIITSVNEMLTQLKPEINQIKQFSYDISNEVEQAGAKVRVPFVDAGTAENYSADARNYGHATGGLSDVFVTLDTQPKVTVPVTQTDALELPNSGYWKRVTESGVMSISKAISKKIGGLFTAENCLGGKVVLASVTKANLAKLRKQCTGRVADTVLILDPDNYADALALFDSNVYGDSDPIKDGVVSRLYGFKAVMCGYDLPEGVTGAIVPYTSVAIATRPVAIPDAGAYPEADV